MVSEDAGIHYCPGLTPREIRWTYYKLAVTLLTAQRESTATLLQLLSKNVWERKGIHEEKEKTLFSIFITALQHIPTHIQQINKIK